MCIIKIYTYGVNTKNAILIIKKEFEILIKDLMCGSNVLPPGWSILADKMSGCAYAVGIDVALR